MIMLDIDDFKSVNDRFGHLSGDEVIRRVGLATREALRDSDIVCRWGGEEFMAVLKGCNRDGAALLAEKVRAAVEALSFTFDETPVRLTVSLGVSQLNDAEMAAENPVEMLLHRADHGLYQAKQGGRNRVCVV